MPGQHGTRPECVILQEMEAEIIAVAERGGEEWGIEHKPVGEKVSYFHSSKNNLFLFVRLVSRLQSL